jgi:hypothetical protein
MRYGVLPLHSADATYGVECEPEAGSVDNLHGDKPWLRKTRLPLQPANAGNRTCCDYTMTENDTFASVAGEYRLRLDVVIYV